MKLSSFVLNSFNFRYAEFFKQQKKKVLWTIISTMTITIFNKYSVESCAINQNEGYCIEVFMMHRKSIMQIDVDFFHDKVFGMNGFNVFGNGQFEIVLMR